MPVNGFNVGIDCTVVLQAVSGSTAQGSISMLVTGFSAKQAVEAITVRPLNTPPLYADLPNGWTGSFKIQRNGPSIEAFVSGNEATYWGGGATVPTMQVFQYVNNPDGSQSVYRFNGAQIVLENAGDYSQDKAVEQEVTFRAVTRTVVQ